MTSPLPILPEITRLSPRVIRILGGNPGKFTLQGTNTYLLGTSDARILIDTGEGKASWPPLLSQSLKEEQAAVSVALITHWHPDHVGGILQLRQLCPSVKVYENDPPDGFIHDISDGEVFAVPGATLRALHCPGHTTNHMAFILEEEDALFTGDNVLGHGTAVFEDLAEYMSSLERMATAFHGRAYPAHGAVIEDGPGKVREYILHRKEREQQVVQALKEGPEEGMTPVELVEVIYKDYPPELYEPAAKGVVLILEKLAGDGRVEKGEADRWKIIVNAEQKL